MCAQYVTSYAHEISLYIMSAFAILYVYLYMRVFLETHEFRFFRNVAPDIDLASTLLFRNFKRTLFFDIFFMIRGGFLLYMT